jgi:hypothetical protein
VFPCTFCSLSHEFHVTSIHVIAFLQLISSSSSQLLESATAIICVKHFIPAYPGQWIHLQYTWWSSIYLVMNRGMSADTSQWNFPDKWNGIFFRDTWFAFDTNICKIIKHISWIYQTWTQQPSSQNLNMSTLIQISCHYPVLKFNMKTVFEYRTHMILPSSIHFTIHLCLVLLIQKVPKISNFS